MSSKLEKKLLQFEKTAPISNDEELIKAIESIIINEESLPIEERDLDLIDEAIDSILSLKKVDIEQLDSFAEKITDKYFSKITDKSKKISKKSKFVKLRQVIPIVAIILILAIGSIVVYAKGYSIASITKEVYMQLVQKVWYRHGNVDIIITEDVNEYKSLEEFLDNVGDCDLLLPYNLPNSYVVDKILEEDYGEHKNISMFITHDNFTQRIKIKTPYFGDLSNVEAEHKIIGNYDVVYHEYDNVYQATFIYGDNYYVVISSSYDILTTMIKNMEEK